LEHLADQLASEWAGGMTSGAGVFQNDDHGELGVRGWDITGEPRVITGWRAALGSARLAGNRDLWQEHVFVPGPARVAHNPLEGLTNNSKRRIGLRDNAFDGSRRLKGVPAHVWHNAQPAICDRRHHHRNLHRCR
jgi:hypothetical protein